MPIPFPCRDEAAQATDHSPSDWAWAIDAIIAGLAGVDPALRHAIAHHLTRQVGYEEADPIDPRQHLLRCLADRLATAAIERD